MSTDNTFNLPQRQYSAWLIDKINIQNTSLRAAVSGSQWTVQC